VSGGVGSGEVERQQVDDVGPFVPLGQLSERVAQPRGKRIKLLGIGVGGLFVVFGISVGSLIVWASDTASSIVQHPLKL